MPTRPLIRTLRSPYKSLDTETVRMDRCMNLYADDIIGLYQRHAGDWDADRGRDLFERPWLDRFLACIEPGGAILDLGCGGAEPIAGYFIARGFKVTGVDSSPSLIETCRKRFPAHNWVDTDMRTLSLNQAFDGVLAWDSFFHLCPFDQRQMFRVFQAHTRARSALMFTSGPAAGEAIGTYRGEPLYHASLDADEYRELLEQCGFEVASCQ